jgi:epoxyqueuosine reductase QueG
MEVVVAAINETLHAISHLRRKEDVGHLKASMRRGSFRIIQVLMSVLMVPFPHKIASADAGVGTQPHL